MTEYYGNDVNPTFVFFCSAFVAESLTILIHFPYDLMKCRL